MAARSLDKEKRKTLVTILTEVGKYTFIGLVIGYFITDPKPLFWVPGAGAAFSLICFASAVILSKE